MTSWRTAGSGALRMGLLHGAYCLGCCWLLFVILFPLGIMNIAAMAVITLLIFAEKTLPWGGWAIRATAAALVAYGVMVLAKPQILPTFMAGEMTVPSAPIGNAAGTGDYLFEATEVRPTRPGQEQGHRTPRAFARPEIDRRRCDFPSHHRHASGRHARDVGQGHGAPIRQLRAPSFFGGDRHAGEMGNRLQRGSERGEGSHPRRRSVRTGFLTASPELMAVTRVRAQGSSGPQRLS